MFGTYQPSQFDVRFRLFGIPIVVHPLFWLIMTLLGQSTLSFGPEYLLIWVACGFGSVLLHELFHALAFRLFGRRSIIVLYACGGFAQPEYALYSPGRKIVVSLAGPLANFLIAGASYLVSITVARDLPIHSHLKFGLVMLTFVNIFWGIFNLLPIYPLDGGQALREVFVIAKARYPDILIHTISICVAGFMAIYGVLTNFTKARFPAIESVLFGYSPGLMGTIFFALFAFENWQWLQRAKHNRTYYDDADVPPWRR